MKIFNKTAFALVLVVFAIGGAYLQNRKTKQYVYNDITLANLNAYMDPENNGSNPETGSSNPETGSNWFKDEWEWWNRKDYVCKPQKCEVFPGDVYATWPEKVKNGKGTEAHSWNCITCADLVPPKVSPV